MAHAISPGLITFSATSTALPEMVCTFLVTNNTFSVTMRTFPEANNTFSETNNKPVNRWRDDVIGSPNEANSLRDDIYLLQDEYHAS